MAGLRSTAAKPKLGWAAAALAGYFLLTLGMTYPLVTQFGRAIPGDGFDGWQNYWNLWWVKVALLEQHRQPWFTPLLYHPTGVGLLFHTLNGFNGFTFLPVQLAWGLIPAYNAVVIFSFTVGGLGAYLLARYALRPGAGRGPAFIAGLVFTFSPYHFAHLLGHMQLISLEWIPFYALYLLRTVNAAGKGAAGRPIAREAALAMLFLVLVTLCDWYYLMYCLIFTVVVGAWLVGRTVLAVARERRARARMEAAARELLAVQHLPRPWTTVLRPWLAGATMLNAVRAQRARAYVLRTVRGIVAVAGTWLAWALVMSPWLVPMVRVAQQFDFMVPDPNQSRILSADLLAFITPQGFHPLWGAWARERGGAFTATISEYTVFAGFTALALAAIALGKRNRPTAEIATARQVNLGLWLTTLAVFFVLALGPVLHVGGHTGLLPDGRELPLPYGLLAQWVPFMDITRSVSRFDTMVMLALGVLAAAGADRLARLGRAGSVATALAAVLILFEFLPAPYPMSPPDTPAWYNTLATDPRSGAVLNLPMNWDRPGYLLYQTVHGKPLTAAYISRDDPRTLVERAPVLQHFRHLGPDVIVFDLARQGQGALADLDVRWVVLDRYKMPGGPERAITEAYAAAIFNGQAPVYADERLTVYEVQSAVPAGPYPTLGVGWEPFDRATGTRAFTGQAPLVVRAPAPGQVTLRIKLAPGSAALDLPQSEGTYVVRLPVTAGVTEVTLRAAEPRARVVINRIELSAE
ncbi:MAG: hypothetical protein ACUVS6_12125 [Anaerolineae bacterium]